MSQLFVYQLSIKFYQRVKSVRLPAHLKTQLLRAASSVTLNLNEGYGRGTRADQARFFQIAFGSIRECQAIVDLESDCFSAESRDLLDHLAAATYKLLRPS